MSLHNPLVKLNRKDYVNNQLQKPKRFSIFISVVK